MNGGYAISGTRTSDWSNRMDLVRARLSRAHTVTSQQSRTDPTPVPPSYHRSTDATGQRRLLRRDARQSGSGTRPNTEPPLQSLLSVKSRAGGCRPPPNQLTPAPIGRCHTRRPMSARRGVGRAASEVLARQTDGGGAARPLAPRGSDTAATRPRHGSAGPRETPQVMTVPSSRSGDASFQSLRLSSAYNASSSPKSPAIQNS